ncbi:MAG: hypothetical protein AAGI11_10320 [Pseudomonadota bacterium]
MFRRFFLILIGYSLASTAGADAPDMTGTYQGVVACDRIIEGKPGTFHKQWSLRVLHRGDRLDVATWTAEEEKTGKRKASLYTGKTRVSEGRVSGYLATCRPAIEASELVRLLPARLENGALSFSADTIFVTEDLPGSPGDLIVENCRWVMDRVSTDTPVMETCTQN